MSKKSNETLWSTWGWSGVAQGSLEPASVKSVDCCCARAVIARAKPRASYTRIENKTPVAKCSETLAGLYRESCSLSALCLHSKPVLMQRLGCQCDLCWFHTHVICGVATKDIPDSQVVFLPVLLNRSIEAYALLEWNGNKTSCYCVFVVVPLQRFQLHSRAAVNCLKNKKNTIFILCTTQKDTDLLK